MAFSQASPQQGSTREMLCKVPEVTLYFWIIKIMATTVGETAADYLNVNLGFGLTGHVLRHGRSARRRPHLPAREEALRAVALLADSHPDQHRRHADHRQPDRQHGRSALDLDGRLLDRARDHLHGLVRQRKDALDPLDLHDEARALLLGGDPLHLRARHGRRRLRHRRPELRLPRKASSSSAA